MTKINILNLIWDVIFKYNGFIFPIYECNIPPFYKAITTILLMIGNTDFLQSTGKLFNTIAMRYVHIK